MIMSTPLVTWILIVGLILIALVVRIVDSLCHHNTRCAVAQSDRIHHNRSHNHHRKLVEIGSEWEEMYIPGDMRHPMNEKYDESLDEDI